MLSFRSTLFALLLCLVAIPLQANDEQQLYENYVENLYGEYRQMALNAFKGKGSMMYKHGLPLARDHACGRTLDGLQDKGRALSAAFEGMKVPGLEVTNYLDRFGAHKKTQTQVEETCQYLAAYQTDQDRKMAFIDFEHRQMPESTSEFEYWLGAMIGCQFDPAVNEMANVLLKKHARILSQVGVIREPFFESQFRAAGMSYPGHDPYNSPTALLAGLMDAAGDPRCADKASAERIVANTLRSQQNMVVFLTKLVQ